VTTIVYGKYDKRLKEVYRILYNDSDIILASERPIDPPAHAKLVSADDAMARVELGRQLR
jgi:hypothetical protein